MSRSGRPSGVTGRTGWFRCTRKVRSRFGVSNGENEMKRVFAAGALAAVAVGLAGCGGSDGDGDAAATSSSSAASTSSAVATSSSAGAVDEEVSFGEVDVYACQQFVDTTVGKAYGWLKNALATGSGDLYEPGGSEFYNIGGFASQFQGQLTYQPLATAVDYIAAHDQEIRSDWDAGTISPALWLNTFETVADACEDGGYQISWNNS